MLGKENYVLTQMDRCILYAVIVGDHKIEHYTFPRMTNIYSSILGGRGQNDRSQNNMEANPG